MRSPVIALIVVLTSCGGGGTDPVDASASASDAPPGAIDARPTDARPIDADPLICPSGFVPTGVTLDGDNGFFTDEDPIFTGLQIFAGTDALGHLLWVTFDSSQVTGPATVDPADFRTGPAYAMIWYNVDAGLSPERAYASTAGALVLTRACDQGVGGTLAGATFEEVVLQDEVPVAILAGGCTFTTTDVTFDIGGACP